MILWAVHDGGFDADTWYWGALATVGLLAASLALLGSPRMGASRASRAAIVLFALYVAWSYLSISWAQAPGVALEGSNRALLYLVVFTLLTLLPWTVEAAMAALLTFAVGVGVIAVVLLFRLASADHVSSLIVGGRLASPTGYENSTAALFTIDALVCTGLATRRELPAPLRGLLLALAAGSLQLAVIVESRGWLFTLPLVAIVTVFCVSDRLRFAGFTLIPVVATLIPIRLLLRIYDAAQGTGLNHAASRGGQESLLLLLAAFVIGTLTAWGDRLVRGTGMSHRARRLVGSLAVAVTIAGGLGGALAVSHGRPFHFISTQWKGFSDPTETNTGSHFTDVGSGRYDFWRVSIDAFLSHPIGGLGQDNFADYYLPRRHTDQEPEWTHSLEMRLLAHTGLVGFLLFAGFIVFALVAAVRTRRRGPPLSRAVAGVALLPLVVWLIHGSVDWFWEFPALSGPALGFLGMAAALNRAESPQPARWVPRLPRPVELGLGVAALLVVVVVLALPYLSVREVSLASDVSNTNPQAALRDLSRAHDLNPLNSNPGKVAGAVALRNGEYRIAAQRFRQSLSEEPQGWFSWLGAGLAASALGDKTTAHRDFKTAYSIDSKQYVVQQALARVYTTHPLTSAQAFSLIVLVE
jgi:hypothetical protein